MVIKIIFRSSPQVSWVPPDCSRWALPTARTWRTTFCDESARWGSCVTSGWTCPTATRRRRPAWRTCCPAANDSASWTWRCRWTPTTWPRPRPRAAWTICGRSGWRSSGYRFKITWTTSRPTLIGNNRWPLVSATTSSSASGRRSPRSPWRSTDRSCAPDDRGDRYRITVPIRPRPPFISHSCGDRHARNTPSPTAHSYTGTARKRLPQSISSCTGLDNSGAPFVEGWQGVHKLFNFLIVHYDI